MCSHVVFDGYVFGTALGVGNKIPDTYGGWTMGISYYVYNIANEETVKETIRNEIKKEMMKISASPFYNLGITLKQQAAV